MRFDSSVAGALLVAAFGCSSGGDDAADNRDAGNPPRQSDGRANVAHDASSNPTTDAGSGMHTGSGGMTSMHGPDDAGAVTHDDDAADRGPPYTDDTYAPWAGGFTYYAKYPNWPRADRSFFPIAVWLQSPDRATDYASIGVNTYIGLWKGPTEDQLSMLASADMPVMCDQNDVGLAHGDDIIAWTQQDEPDNAQAAASGNGYDPCIPASEVKARYDAIKAKDPSRPVYLNLGQGVAHDYVGWGNECAATHPADYPDYLEGADIVSFDIYPSNETAADVAGKLWFVAEGVKNLVGWAQGKKPVWNWIECTGIDDPSREPTPTQVKAEVWMSIVHGSMGIGYFVHQFNPTSDEHALLDDENMKGAVSNINSQIKQLAPVLNEKSVTNGGSVTSDDPDVPVAMLLKREGGATYIFAVAMRGSPTHAKFAGLTHIPAGATVTVIDEDRMFKLDGDGFEDDFAPWGVHLYKVTLVGSL